MLGYVDVDKMEEEATMVLHKLEFHDNLEIDETPVQKREENKITYDELLLVIDRYTKEKISFGKAVDLSKLGTMKFLAELQKRGIKLKSHSNSLEDELEIFNNTS